VVSATDPHGRILGFIDRNLASFSDEISSLDALRGHVICCLPHHEIQSHIAVADRSGRAV
jgi:hypothetical protein